MDGSSRVGAAATVRTARDIRIDFVRVTPLGSLERTSAVEPYQPTERVLRVVVGTGRGSVLQSSSMLPTVLVPLRGCVQVADGDCSRTLRPKQLFVTEGGQFLQAVGGDAALWIALVAPAVVWQQLINATTETPVVEPVLLPAVHEAHPIVRRAAIRVARDGYAAGSEDLDATRSALAFATLLTELQAAFDPQIRRCPGRTRAKRRAVFARLQRAYSWMVTGGNLDLDVSGFARVASYSTCHFVRTFSEVFGRTPHSVLAEQRLKRAFRLVYDSELSITEVARASGFEDRCAFARSFKRRFGRTATAVRSGPDAAVL